MPRRRAAEATAATVSPEMIWLAMTGRMAKSCAAAKGDRDLAADWLSAMLELARQGVDEKDPSAVRRLVTSEVLDALRVEAEDYDFAPWVISGRAPAGDGFKRWRTEFLAQHDGRRVR